jgi:hypothetical protein
LVLRFFNSIFTQIFFIFCCLLNSNLMTISYNFSIYVYILSDSVFEVARPFFVCNVFSSIKHYYDYKATWNSNDILTQNCWII